MITTSYDLSLGKHSKYNYYYVTYLHTNMVVQIVIIFGDYLPSSHYVVRHYNYSAANNKRATSTDGKLFTYIKVFCLYRQTIKTNNRPRCFRKTINRSTATDTASHTEEMRSSDPWHA